MAPKQVKKLKIYGGEHASDIKSSMRDQIYPPFDEMSLDKTIVGLRWFTLSHACPLQLIFSDGSKSQFDQCRLPEPNLSAFWTEKKIPAGSRIRRVQMLYKKQNQNLEGLRFLCPENKLLVAVGEKDNTQWHTDPDYQLPSKEKELGLKEFTLEEGHFLVGAKSGSRNIQQARHFDFQFYIGFYE